MACSTARCAWTWKPRRSWRRSSEPCPRRGPADAVPDLRPGAQRRGQALIELVRRAVSCPGSLPTAAKATLLVTIGWQDLLAELGAGTTIASCDARTLLGPAAIRRLACDAGIIPAVLGTDGQVLDLGRESRWFTPAQAKALWLRDRACTIPDRSMPAPPSGATRMILCR